MLQSSESNAFVVQHTVLCVAEFVTVLFLDRRWLDFRMLVHDRFLCFKSMFGFILKLLY